MPVTKSTHLHGQERKTHAKPHAHKEGASEKLTHTLRMEVVLHNGLKLVHEKQVALDGEPDSDVLADFQRESIAHFNTELKPGESFDNSATACSAEKIAE